MAAWNEAQNSWPRGKPMNRLSPATARATPSPLNGERAGVRGENADRLTYLPPASDTSHGVRSSEPSPAVLVERLLPQPSNRRVVKTQGKALRTGMSALRGELLRSNVMDAIEARRPGVNNRRGEGGPGVRRLDGRGGRPGLQIGGHLDGVFLPGNRVPGERERAAGF